MSEYKAVLKDKFYLMESHKKNLSLEYKLDEEKVSPLNINWMRRKYQQYAKLIENFVR